MNDKYKEHDSVMNTLDWSLSNSMGVDYLKLFGN